MSFSIDFLLSNWVKDTNESTGTNKASLLGKADWYAAHNLVKLNFGFVLEMCLPCFCVEIVLLLGVNYVDGNHQMVLVVHTPRYPTLLIISNDTDDEHSPPCPPLTFFPF